MFYSLFFSTLPLFGLVLIGFISGKFDLLNKSDSKVFLKLIGLVIVPALGIKIIGNFRGLIIFFFQIHLPLSVNRLVNFICDAGIPCALIAILPN